MSKAERRRKNRSVNVIKANWSLMTDDERDIVHAMAVELVRRSDNRHRQKAIDRAILDSIPENF